MGLPVDKIGSFFTGLVQKGDPEAAMAAGKGPVTAEWAKAHGYKKLRSPGVPLTTELLKMVPPAITLYGTYLKSKKQKKRIQGVKKETERKIKEHIRTGKKHRILRRPSRERGIS